MRHKDILLNKSDQMFVKDLLKITQNLEKNLVYLLLKSPRLMERMNCDQAKGSKIRKGLGP